jgi:thiol:disulfide interchange protein
MSLKSRKFLRFALIAALAYGVYLADVERRSYLGRQAFEATGLKSLALEDALPIAAAESKPILVEVSAVWCPTCRALSQKVMAAPKVRDRINESYIFVRLDYESEAGEQFMDRVGVRGFPMLFVLGPDGELREQLRITMDPDAFVTQLANSWPPG